MQKISENAIELVQNPFGNYAVTEVLNVRVSNFNFLVELGYRDVQTYSAQVERKDLLTKQLEILFQCNRALFRESGLKNPFDVHRGVE